MKLHRESISVNGPVGKLECILESPGDAPPLGAAVCCHPHPLYGGTLTNKVTHTLARAFLAVGFAALRFNFRGVGASQGEYSNGVGETEDAGAALSWMRDRYPAVPLFLAGFSFGGAVALGAAEGEDLAALVTVAPAVGRIAVPHGTPECPWLVIQGSADELVPLDDTIHWLNGLEPGPELAVINEADHFFHGRLIELRDLVVDFLGRQTPIRQGEQYA